MNAPLTTTEIQAHNDIKLAECQDAIAALPADERATHLELHVRWNAAQNAAQEAFCAYRKALNSAAVSVDVPDVGEEHSAMIHAAVASLAAWYNYEESCARVFAAVRA